MIFIPLVIYDALLAYVTAVAPLEACGFLAGTQGRVCHLYPIHNILASPVAYKMSPDQQIKAMLDMEARQWEMLAIFHSHPTGPDHPSISDIQQAYYPESATLIVSLHDPTAPTVKAYQISNGRYHPIPLTIQ